MTEKEIRELSEKMAKRQRLKQKVYELYEECEEFDDGVRMYFDTVSDKMLGKKVKVLSQLIEGKSPDEIGKDYFDILEGFDKESIPEGAVADVGGWEYDAEKYR